MIVDISNVIEERVEINEKYHKSFVAKRGEFLHKLEDECGGIKISFPKPGTGDKVILKGSKSNVALAKQKLLDHVKILVCIYQKQNYLKIIIVLSYFLHFPIFLFVLILFLILFQENTIQVEVNVDPKYHRHFVARRGEIINRIIDDCNGVSITFPKVATNDSVVIIKGDKRNAEEAKHKIVEMVKDLVSIHFYWWFSELRS